MVANPFEGFVVTFVMSVKSAAFVFEPKDALKVVPFGPPPRKRFGSFGTGVPAIAVTPGAQVVPETLPQREVVAA